MRSGTEDSNCHLETVLMGDLPNTVRVKSWHGRLTPTKEAFEMNDPPTTTPRANELFLLIQRDLEVARTAEAPEREAVLLRGLQQDQGIGDTRRGRDGRERKSQARKISARKVVLHARKDLGGAAENPERY